MGQGAGADDGEDSELGFGGGAKSEVDPIGDIDKARLLPKITTTHNF
jgi:hypothetical protein